MASHLYLEPWRREGPDVEVAARLEGRDGNYRLWWRLPQEWSGALTQWADPFIVAFLFPMMQTGDNVTVEGAASPSLLANLETFMAIWQAWFPKKYRCMQIRARDEIEPPSPREPGLSVVPLSCGIDSCFTLLRHQRGLMSRRNRKIGAAVVMNGFDIWLDQPNAAAIYAGLLTGAQAMLKSLQIHCIPMASNFHELPTIWGHSFGTHLVGGMRLLGKTFDAAMVPNGMPYFGPLIPWAANPLIDPFFSSRQFTVTNDGGEAGRVEKAALLTQWPEAMQHLRVCFSNPDSHTNCCRCEKCVRTILAFRVAGSPRPGAFAQHVTDQQIRRVKFRQELVLDLWYEVLEGINARELLNTTWAAAVRTMLRRNRLRFRIRRLKQSFIPLRNKLRRWFRGSALSRHDLAKAAHEIHSASNSS